MSKEFEIKISFKPGYKKIQRALGKFAKSCEELQALGIEVVVSEKEFAQSLAKEIEKFIVVKNGV